MPASRSNDVQMDFVFVAPPCTADTPEPPARKKVRPKKLADSMPLLPLDPAAAESSTSPVISPQRPPSPSVGGIPATRPRIESFSRGDRDRDWAPSANYFLPVSDEERIAANAAARSAKGAGGGWRDDVAGYTGDYGCGSDGESFRTDLVCEILRVACRGATGDIFIGGCDVPAFIALSGINRMGPLCLHSDDIDAAAILRDLYPSSKMGPWIERNGDMGFAAHLSAYGISAPSDAAKLLGLIAPGRRALICSRPASFLDDATQSAQIVRSELNNEYHLEFAFRFLPRGHGGGLDVTLFRRRTFKPPHGESAVFVATGTGYLPWQKSNMVYLMGYGVFLDGSHEDDKKVAAILAAI